jgi:ribonuclease-3
MANATIEKILQYHFQDPGLLEEALQADGLTPSRSLEDPRTYGNRGLALIGDAILRLVVVNDGIELGKTLSKFPVHMTATKSPQL